MFAEMPIAAYRATLDGVIVSANRALARFVAQSDLVGVGITEVLGTQYGERLLEVVRAGGRIEGERVSIGTADGTILHARHHAWPMVGSDLFEGIIEDLTARVAMQDELNASVELFRHAFSQGPVGMSMADPATGRFIAANPALCNMLGYSEEEMLSLTIADITHPEHREHDLAEMQRLARSEIDLFETEKRYLRADGGEMWGAVSVSMIRDTTGAPTYALARVQDLTTRRSAEADAHFKATVLEHVDSAVVVTDVEGRITYWNPAAQRLYRWEPDEVIGRRVIDVNVPRASIDAARQIMASLIEGGSWVGELEVGRRDGSTFVAHLASSVITDSDGAVIGIVGISHDLTQRKEIERQLTEMAASKDMFIAAISHELRTPLTAVVGFAELLEETVAGTLPSEASEMLEAIVLQSNDLASIVDDLLIAVRGDIGRFDIDDEVVVLGTAVETVLVSLGLEPPVFGDEIRVIGDAARIRQIVRNLVTNSQLHGGNRIDVTAEPVGGRVRLVVSDDGPGVAEENVERLFEPYWRERRGERGAAIGLGLGLPISRMLAEAMGGTLDYERVGDESHFVLTLPAA